MRKKVQPQGLWNDSIERKENVAMRKKNYCSQNSYYAHMNTIFHCEHNLMARGGWITTTLINIDHSILEKSM
jgi:hypothetical protein